MPHVITQACCIDGACGYAWPVDFIQPSPDERGVAAAEVLLIGPEACVDCGAFVDSCPVGAIAALSKRTEDQLPFSELSAGL